jgi:NAD(P)H-hydrate epimerase
VIFPRLVSAETARALDAEASAHWGLHPFALVEAAGRECARVFHETFPGFFPRAGEGFFPRILVLSGGGNNGADAMVMLRALILRGLGSPFFSRVVLSRIPGPEDQGPWAEACRSLEKMQVPLVKWDGDEALLSPADIIIDGIAGTGLKGPLHGGPGEMVQGINRLKEKPRGGNGPDQAGLSAAGAGSDQAGQSPAETMTAEAGPAVSPALVVSIDVPSGNCDLWKPGMPMVKADAVLAIEPQKLCLYKPPARPFGGKILPVGGIFPQSLINQFEGVPLMDWESLFPLIDPVKPEAYKHQRGVVEIRAGSPGSTGAAKLAARGAQAAGAGMVRLIADPSIYPILAGGAWGIMVVPGDVVKNPGPENPGGRFSPGAALAGPGWGTGPDRARLLQNYLAQEEEGMPLILDADAIALAGGAVFHGNAILDRKSVV